MTAMTHPDPFELPLDAPEDAAPPTPEERAEARGRAFLLRALGPAGGGPPLKAALNPDMPRCPVCAAPALAGRHFTAYWDLEHDCNCVRDAAGEYLSGLRRAHATRAALPAYLGTLPVKFHAARHTDYAGTATAPLALALAAAPTTAFLFGPPGIGKSHLAAAVGHAAARAGQRAAYMHATAYVNAVRAASTPGGPPRPDHLSAQVLIVDDLAKMKPTDFSYEALFMLIEDRWAHQRPTIFTSNYDPRVTAELMLPGASAAAVPLIATPERALAVAALASRLSAGVILPVSGRDQRASGL